MPHRFTGNTRISGAFHLKCTETADCNSKSDIIFGIFEESSLKTVISNPPEMRASQLEMHERPIPGKLILWLLLYFYSAT